MTDRPSVSDDPARVPATSLRRSAARVIAIAALAAVLAVAVWFRLSSLGAVPAHGADESYYGIQAWRLAHGQSFRLYTVTGNVIDPFLVVAQAPLYWFVEPAAWGPRLPVALSGILAAGLAFVLFRKVLDGPTALAAATVHATLPAAIMFARFGCEFGQTPLAGVVAAYFALRGRFGWLVVSVAVALLVHPTNVFLVPILGPVALLRLVEGARGDPTRARRAWRSLAAMLVAATVAGASLWMRPEVRAIVVGRLARLGAMDWRLFLDGYRYLLGQGPLLPGGPRLESSAVIAGTVALLVVGLSQQVRRRQWDRLALASGLALGIAALHLLGGTDVLWSAVRYGAVLITPTALVVAGLLQGAFPRVATGDPRAIGPSRIAVAALLGATLLAAADRNVFRPARIATGESIWTFRGEAEDPYRRIVDHIRADLTGSPAVGRPPRLVLAQDYFVAMPLTFLLADDPDLAVVQLVSIPQLGEYVMGGDPMAPRLPRIVERLSAGDYAVRGPSAAEPCSRFLERLIADSFPADRVRRWEVPRHPELRVYRIDPSPAPGLALDAGTDGVGR